MDNIQDDSKRKAAQDKWRKLLANHIEEGRRQGRSEIDSMDQSVFLSRVMTPEENADYNWAFEGVSRGVPWRKWGGGNKRASGTNATRKAAIAKISQAVGDSPNTVNVTLSPDANVNKYQQSSYDDGFGFTINQALARVNARFNDTQGKNMPSNPSFGYSNHSRINSYNTHGVGTRADGSRSTYGVNTSSVGKFRGFNTLGGLGLVAGDPNRGLNRGKTYGKDGDIKSITTDSDFGLRMRKAMEGWTPTA